jgi:glycerate kinase
VLAAPDKFRSTLTAGKAASAIAAGIAAAGDEAVSAPLADGGEGTLATVGGPNRQSRVRGPLGEIVQAGWRLDGDTALVEMAQASGLEIVGGSARNRPLDATTFGTGQLIAEAADAGATKIIVGVGGSATTDGGRGALEALEEYIPFEAHGLEIRVACDVKTTFVEAAAVFGPQKGATPADVAVLETRLVEWARELRERFGVDVTALEGGGAAGGIAGGLAAAGASVEPGFDLVADFVSLDDALTGVDYVVTGEGRLDASSFNGKVVGMISARCLARDLPLLIVVGSADGVRTPHKVISLTTEFGAERASSAAARCLQQATCAYFRSQALGRS